MKVNNKFIIGLLAVTVGAMFIVLKGEVISIALTLLGIAAIAMGIMDITRDNKNSGIMKIVLGAAIILFGWLFVEITLTVISVLMILFCAMDLIGALKTGGYPMDAVQSIRTYAKPMIGLVAGVCLLLNQGRAVSWAFVIVGIIFVAEGILMLMESK